MMMMKSWVSAWLRLGLRGGIDAQPLLSPSSHKDRDDNDDFGFVDDAEDGGDIDEEETEQKEGDDVHEHDDNDDDDDDDAYDDVHDDKEGGDV